jgi:Peptidase family M23
VFVLIAAVFAFAPAAQADTWRWPVRGEVVEHFRLGPNPYARGQHRGIDIAAAPGAPVRAACAGRVRFAGTVPRHGRTVSVKCGGLVATYLHLRATTVRRGQRVAGGDRIGTADGPIQLGARRAGRRQGYVDPLTLLEAQPAEPGPPPLPPARPHHSPPAARPSPLPPRVPAPAWAGIVLLGVAVPGLALVGARRRRARAAASRALALRRAAR